MFDVSAHLVVKAAKLGNQGGAMRATGPGAQEQAGPGTVPDGTHDEQQQQQGCGRRWVELSLGSNRAAALLGLAPAAAGACMADGDAAAGGPSVPEHVHASVESGVLAGMHARGPVPCSRPHRLILVHSGCRRLYGCCPVNV